MLVYLFFSAQIFDFNIRVHNFIVLNGLSVKTICISTVQSKMANKKKMHFKLNRNINFNFVEKKRNKTKFQTIFFFKLIEYFKIFK